MTKKCLTSAFVALLTSVLSVAQTENQTKDKGIFSGGFESNAQWYLNDKGLKDIDGNSTVHPPEPLRSNSYLFVN